MSFNMFTNNSCVFNWEINSSNCRFQALHVVNSKYVVLTKDDSYFIEFNSPRYRVEHLDKLCHIQVTLCQVTT